MSIYIVSIALIQAVLIQNAFCQYAGIGHGNHGLPYPGYNMGPNINGLAPGMGGPGYGLNPGYPQHGVIEQGFIPALADYGGTGVGDVEVAGEMPVAGTTAVAGQVPVYGTVRFGGDIAAGGIISVSGGCGCNGFSTPFVY